MSLSLMTLLGNQKPTSDEKYILSQCIKVLRFHKYPCGKNDVGTPMEANHNKILDNIISGLRKTLNL